jgi:hypothetical protein
MSRRKPRCWRKFVASAASIMTITTGGAYLVDRLLPHGGSSGYTTDDTNADEAAHSDDHGSRSPASSVPSDDPANDVGPRAPAPAPSDTDEQDAGSSANEDPPATTSTTAAPPTTSSTVSPPSEHGESRSCTTDADLKMVSLSTGDLCDVDAALGMVDSQEDIQFVDGSIRAVSETRLRVIPRGARATCNADDGWVDVIPADHLLRDNMFCIKADGGITMLAEIESAPDDDRLIEFTVDEVRPDP